MLRRPVTENLMNHAKSSPTDVARTEIRLGRNLATATADELAALRRLLAVARHDTGQSKRVAAFLLAWWNATTCGGFDFTDLWCVDRDLAIDMLTIIGMIARIREYPPALGLRQEFLEVLRAWRPHLFADADPFGADQRDW
jgi:hypothetical protein